MSDAINLKIHRPCSDELRAIISDSSNETNPVNVKRVLYDFLKSQLHNDAFIDRWVNDRITNELIRLTKIGGRGAVLLTKSQRSKAMTTRWNRWREENNRTKGERRKPQNTIRVRVYDDAYLSFMRIDDDRIKRVSIAGEILLSGLKSIDADAFSAYAKSHIGTPDNFITIPKRAADEAKVIAREKNTYLMTLVSYILRWQ